MHVIGLIANNFSLHAFNYFLFYHVILNQNVIAQTSGEMTDTHNFSNHVVHLNQLQAQ